MRLFIIEFGTSMHLFCDKRFDSLEMEIHTRCNYDFVAAFNGNSTLPDDEIGRYCGNQTEIPPILKSNNRIMTVQFKTDRSVNGRG